VDKVKYNELREDHDKIAIQKKLNEEKEKLNNIMTLRKQRTAKAHEDLVNTYKKMVEERIAQEKLEIKNKKFHRKAWKHITNFFKKFTKYK
jgi:hypothetical protein